MTSNRKGAGDPPPVLSPEDQEIVARWRAEVGEERLQRIAAALAPGNGRGRPSLEQERRPLLLAMARLKHAKPNASVRQLAREVASSPAGRAIPNQSYEALYAWLRQQFSKYGAKLMREVAAAPTPAKLSSLRIASGSTSVAAAAANAMASRAYEPSYMADPVLRRAYYPRADYPGPPRDARDAAIRAMYATATDPFWNGLSEAEKVQVAVAVMNGRLSAEQVPDRLLLELGVNPLAEK